MANALEEASYRDLSRLLTAMGLALGGKAMRTAANDAMKPALEQAREGAPVANPPYGPYANHPTPVNPYPKKTYKGRRVMPGFAERNVRSVSGIFDGGNRVRVAIGVRKEAFYALSFIEMGTSKFAKRPWLEPSFRHSVTEVDRVLIERLKELIDKAVGK